MQLKFSVLIGIAASAAEIARIIFFYFYSVIPSIIAITLVR